QCDEQKPSCRKCELRGTSCLYTHKHPLGGADASSTLSSQKSAPNASLPPPILDTSRSTTFTMLDLELVHSWTSTSGPVTFREKPSNSSTFHLTCFEIALQHPFLMHEILSLSALYLAQTKPESVTPYNLASTAHHDLALSLSQPAFATLSPLNADACFAFSMLLIAHLCIPQPTTSNRNSPPLSQICQDSGPMHIQWIKMHRGIRAIRTAASPWLADGAFAQFSPLQDLIETSTLKPLPLLEQQHLDSLANVWVISLHADSVKETLNEALAELRYLASFINTSESDMKHIPAMAWLSSVPEEFVRLVELQVPEAMLILASYAVYLKRIQYMWWCKGAGEALLNVVMGVLGADSKSKWKEYLRWPTREALGQR
ncbi:hypothetical protein B0O99DRAFT_524416, partial [Bisporella sp. PMI_857]